MEISNRCSESSVRIAMVLSSDFAEKSLPLSILNTEDSSNFSLDVPSVANAGMHRYRVAATAKVYNSRGGLVDSKTSYSGEVYY